jgi:hypothetical protein
MRLLTLSRLRGGRPRRSRIPCRSQAIQTMEAIAAIVTDLAGVPRRSGAGPAPVWTGCGHRPPVCMQEPAQGGSPGACRATWAPLSTAATRVATSVALWSRTCGTGVTPPITRAARSDRQPRARPLTRAGRSPSDTQARALADCGRQPPGRLRRRGDRFTRASARPPTARTPSDASPGG